MKSLTCLYVHDHVFKKNKDNYYSEGKITDAVFSRYINESESLIVYSRIEESDDQMCLTKISLENVNFSPVRGRAFSKIFSRHIFYNIKLALQLIKLADFIVVRLPSFLGLFILILNVIFKKRFFIEMVGDPKEALLNSKNKVDVFFKIFVRILVFLNKIFIKNADGVIYVTQFELQKKYPSFTLQSYASNVELDVLNKDLILEFYKKRNDPFKIGLIGSFNNGYKGIDTAIQALNFIAQRKYNVFLHIVGSGSLKDFYLDLAKDLSISDRVIFDGVLSGGEQVNQWLDSLSLYIQPSKTEGLPRALIEAMARGLPALASNVGGIPELLSSDFLIEDNSPEQLAKKIELFIESPDFCYEQGKINYDKSKEYSSNILKERRSKFWNEAKAIVERDMK